MTLCTLLVLAVGHGVWAEQPDGPAAAERPAAAARPEIPDLSGYNREVLESICKQLYRRIHQLETRLEALRAELEHLQKPREQHMSDEGTEQTPAREGQADPKKQARQERGERGGSVYTNPQQIYGGMLKAIKFGPTGNIETNLYKLRLQSDEWVTKNMPGKKIDMSLFFMENEGGMKIGDKRGAFRNFFVLDPRSSPRFRQLTRVDAPHRCFVSVSGLVFDGHPKPPYLQPKQRVAIRGTVTKARFWLMRTYTKGPNLKDKLVDFNVHLQIQEDFQFDPQEEITETELPQWRVVGY